MKLCLHWADRHKGRLIVVLYCLFVAGLAWSGYVRLKAPSSGDEPFYVQQTEYLLEHGLTSALVDGNPIGFTLPIALMHKAGVPILMAGRVISLLSVVPVLIGVFYLSRHIVGLRPPMGHFVVVFSLQVILGTGWFVKASSDPLFTAVLLWAVIFLCKSLRNDQRWHHSIAAGILTSIALLIRPLALLHLPAFCLAALALLVVTKCENLGRVVRTGATVLVIFAAFFLLQQLPSLIQNGTIAMENKNPRDRSVTWIQRTSLSQLRYEDGTQPEGHLVTFDDVEEYLATEGEDSLPRGLCQSMLWSPYRTIREFVKDTLLTSQYVCLRRTGLFYLISIYLHLCIFIQIFFHF